MSIKSKCNLKLDSFGLYFYVVSYNVSTKRPLPSQEKLFLLEDVYWGVNLRGRAFQRDEAFIRAT